jgi:hypothetical protein
MTKEGAEALLVLEVPVPFTHRIRIAELAARNRLPTMFPGGQADSSGLIIYGTSVADTWPLMSAQADKILKGAVLGDLPRRGCDKARIGLQPQDGAGSRNRDSPWPTEEGRAHN